MLAPAEDPSRAMLQFFCFPLLFPFFFLFYTDVPSLALVLWALRFSMSGRHRVAGLIGMASLLVRQNNVAWIAFIALLQMLELHAAHLDRAARLRAILALWPYAVTPAIFAAYWWWNGAISLSREQADAHPDLALHGTNVCFMLFLAAIFLSPLLPTLLQRYVEAVRARRSLLLIPALLGILYFTTFVVDHPHNLGALHLFLRNNLLNLVTVHRWAYVCFGLVVMIGACALSQVRWCRPSFILLLPVSALFVSFSWLIEQRYYLIPFSLLLALRRPEGPRAEWMLLALWAPVAVGFLYGIVTSRFFL